MEDQTERGPSEADGGASGVYETDDGRIVLYDEGNPDAYIRSDLTLDVER